ncbi:MAG: DUF599 family protein [Beijerinckiaceae bacterium]|jgi:uncharacterized membrane protein|nr:DUF599 family protein [Beijerinckiaceae bacterium]
MHGFGVWDFVALIGFVAAWLGYHVAVERGPHAERSLNARMNVRRRRWLEQAMLRDNRIIDTQVMNGLQNGTAFFASTSLIAVGGAVTLLGATDQIMQVRSDFPLAGITTRLSWEIKVVGLVVIFAYAFFKFAWSYRLFNYSAILLGALPAASPDQSPEARRALEECLSMNVAAGRHFNRGQRAFFFVLAYLGWFISPLALGLFTVGVMVVMWNRQFGRSADDALATGSALS